MMNRKTRAALAVAATIGLVTPAAALQPAAAQEKVSERSLVKVLQADGNRLDRNWEDFDVLHRAVTTVLAAKPRSSVGVLADGDKALTAFLPTDRAFRDLVFQMTGKRPPGEWATFNRLASTAGVDMVEAVLLYHVVPGATVTYRQARQAGGTKLTTAAGSNLTVRVLGDRVWLRDADTDDQNARVLRRLRNINQGNAQIAHGVDRVLRPVNLP